MTSANQQKSFQSTQRGQTSTQPSKSLYSHFKSVQDPLSPESMHVGLGSDSKLATGVDMRMKGCLSPCVSPVTVLVPIWPPHPLATHLTPFANQTASSRSGLWILLLLADYLARHLLIRTRSLVASKNMLAAKLMDDIMWLHLFVFIQSMNSIAETQ